MHENPKQDKSSNLDAEKNLSSSIDWPTRKRIFKLFLYVVIFTNFDTGVIPACVSKIEEEMDIGSFGIAALGSLPFFAISLASVMVSPIIKRFKSKPTLFIALICNVIVCIFFAISYNLALLYIMRFLMGFTQAFWVIYAPVWTNHSSPIKSQSTWLGLLQGFSPLGIILGYLCTGIVIENWDESYAWRLVIIIQAVCEIPIVFFMFFINENDIEIGDNTTQSLKTIEENYEKEAEENNNNNEEVVVQEEITLDQTNQIFKHYKILLKNGLYISTVLTLTVAFFVVYGVQFWSTTYIVEIFDIDSSTAIILYACLTVTSPIGGVFFGGYFSDKMGGYKGENMLNAIKICLSFCIISVFVGIPSAFVYKVYFWAPLIWTQIFFGACNIPGATGIVVNSVPREYQTSASALAQMVYNMLAYFASPLFSGGIMDLFSSSTEGMLWGYRANEFVSILSIVFCALALYFGEKNSPTYKETTQKTQNEVFFYSNELNFFLLLGKI